LTDQLTGPALDRPPVPVPRSMVPGVPPSLLRADGLELVVTHLTQLVERGPFVVAVCSGCHWQTFARRSRPLARAEGREHERLHAP
jgi:hypothetical protein